MSISNDINTEALYITYISSKFQDSTNFKCAVSEAIPFFSISTQIITLTFIKIDWSWIYIESILFSDYLLSVMNEKLVLH